MTQIGEDISHKGILILVEMFHINQKDSELFFWGQ